MIGLDVLLAFIGREPILGGEARVPAEGAAFCGRQRDKWMNANFRNFALWVIIGLVLIALFNLFQNSGQRVAGRDIPYSQFLGEVDQGKVHNVIISGQQIAGIYSDGGAFQTFAPEDPELVKRLEARGVAITAK